MTEGMRLELVGVGPQRAGTTWLFECLRDHPELCFPREVKETFFFDRHFANGWGWYRAHFPEPAPGQRLAEIGPTYFAEPAAAERIHAHNPACRVIVSLRDPAERTFSLYLHHLKKGRVPGDFAAALRQMPELLETSRYAVHLPRWLRVFGAERVRVVLHDDIAGHPERVLQEVYAFAGLAAVPAPPEARERVNAASLPRYPRLARAATTGAEWLRGRGLYGAVNLAKRLGLKRVYRGRRGGVPALDRETRALLVRQLEPDIAYVEMLLGRELPGWR
ncbi:MAG TPA: sulfotransferase [Longimicrobium sp.]|nr:sulfotransferase [Longimicrobium sp.]